MLPVRSLSLLCEQLSLDDLVPNLTMCLGKPEHISGIQVEVFLWKLVVEMLEARVCLLSAELNAE